MNAVDSSKTKYKTCYLRDKSVCKKPAGYCTGEDHEYVRRDCDGDGILDHYCMFQRMGQAGFISSSNVCTDTWPKGICPYYGYYCKSDPKKKSYYLGACQADQNNCDNIACCLHEKTKDTNLFGGKRCTNAEDGLVDMSKCADSINPCKKKIKRVSAPLSESRLNPDDYVLPSIAAFASFAGLFGILHSRQGKQEMYSRLLELTEDEI